MEEVKFLKSFQKEIAEMLIHAGWQRQRLPWVHGGIQSETI
jgi:hypothetical protein